MSSTKLWKPVVIIFLGFASLMVASFGESGDLSKILSIVVGWTMILLALFSFRKRWKLTVPLVLLLILLLAVANTRLKNYSSGDWKDMTFNQASFQYPADWKIEDFYYTGSRFPERFDPSESPVGIDLISPQGDKIFVFGSRVSMDPGLCGVYPREKTLNCVATYLGPVWTESQNQETIDVFRHLVGTLKLPTDDPGSQDSGWKTYRDDAHGLQIRYPDTIHLSLQTIRQLDVRPDGKLRNRFNIGIVTEDKLQSEYYVEVFRKPVEESLDQALRRQFSLLVDYPDCQIKTTEGRGDFPVLAFLDFLQEPMDCPTYYAGGRSMFAYNPKYPDRFIFATTGISEPPFEALDGSWWPWESLSLY